MPLYLTNKKLARDNDHLKSQIEEQKQMKPIYASLLNELTKRKECLVLPNPGQERLARGNTARFKNDLQTIAEKSKTKLSSFKPDLSTLSGSSSSLLHDVVLKGEFNNLRQVLIGLGAVPYIDKIENIEIQQSNDALNFKMKIWVALQ